MQQVERPPTAGLEEVEEQPVPAAVDHARAEAARQCGDEEDRPTWRRSEPDQADGNEPGRERQDPAATEPLGDEAAAERAGRPGSRKQEVEQADSRVGLVERLLDRSDKRRHEQSAPADEQECDRADDASGYESGHGGM